MTVILFNCVPFQILLKERICFQRERIHFFESSSLWYGKSLLPHYLTTLEWYYFYYARANCVMGATPIIGAHTNVYQLLNTDSKMSVKL